MNIINAKVTQAVWYGLASTMAFWGLTLYKPNYSVCWANVKRI